MVYIQSHYIEVAQVSLVEQYTIDCEYLAYFLPKKLRRDNLQLFSADATNFFKTFIFLAHENMKNPASKVSYNWHTLFSVLPTGPKSA